MDKGLNSNSNNNNSNDNNFFRVFVTSDFSFEENMGKDEPV